MLLKGCLLFLLQWLSMIFGIKEEINITTRTFYSTVTHFHFDRSCDILIVGLTSGEVYTYNKSKWSQMSNKKSNFVETGRKVINLKSENIDCERAKQSCEEKADGYTLQPFENKKQVPRIKLAYIEQKYNESISSWLLYSTDQESFLKKVPSQYKLHYDNKPSLSPGNRDLYFSFAKLRTRYLYGFVRAKWIYLVVTYDRKNSQVVTKLLRFSKNEDQSFSNRATALECKGKRNKYIYTRATSAYLTDKIQLFRNNSGTLYVNYATAEPKNRLTGHGNSVLCKFTLTDIDTILSTSNEDDTRNNRNCNNENCDNSATVLRGSVLAAFPGVGSSLAVTTQNHQVVSFIGTTSGDLLVFNLRENIVSSARCAVPLQHYLVGHNTSTEDVLQRSFLDNDEANLWLLVGNTVVNFPLKSCALHGHRNTASFIPSQCGWCKDKLFLRVQRTAKSRRLQKRDDNEAAVTLVDPFNGPTLGGTKLKLLVNFGKHEINNLKEQIRFSIDGNTCREPDLTEDSSSSGYSWSAMCETTESGDTFKGKVVMQIFNEHDGAEMESVESLEDFSYLKPKLYGVNPGFGPKSGGTTLTLKGENLKIGKIHAVLLADTTCDIKVHNDTTILCITKAIDSPIKAPVTVLIDGNCYKPSESQHELEGHFEYKEDPTITKIDPTSLLSCNGATELRIYGDNLDTVAKPFIRLTKTESGILLKECEPQKNEMLCSIPAQNPSEKFETQVSFTMDGVLDQDLFKTVSKTLSFYQCPKFEDNQSYTVGNNMEQIIIKVQDFPDFLKAKDVEILVEDELLCTEPKLSERSIQCKFLVNVIEELWIKHRKEIYELKVKIQGQYFTAGTLRISQSGTVSPRIHNNNRAGSLHGSLWAVFFFGGVVFHI